MQTRAEVVAELTGAGGPFEITSETVNGWSDIKVYANRPRSLREMFAGNRASDAPFLVAGDRRWTFAEFAADADRLAAGLRSIGVGRGDRVAVLAANCPEWVLAFWATVNIGAVCVGLNGWWEPAEISEAVARTEPKVLIADPKRMDRIAAHLDDWDIDQVVVGSYPPADAGRSAPDGEGAEPGRGRWPSTVRPFEELMADGPGGPPDAPIDEDDPAVLFFTSGTTGAAKGVVNTHRGLVACMQNIFLSGLVGMRLAPDAPTGVAAPQATPDVTLMTSPFFHVAGCHAGITLGWLTGQCLVLPEGRLDAGHVTALIERHRVTAWPAVPALVWRVVQDPVSATRDLSSVRRLSFGGAAASPELVARASALFGNVADKMATGWGLTETTAALTSHLGPDYTADPLNVGHPYPLVDIRFVDPDTGEDADDRAGGEIWARGCQVMPSYWRDPVATAEVLTSDGWFRTGDIGHLDAVGRLHLTDRLKDMILRGGENVSSTEVEHRLTEHPDVADVAVVGQPHPTLGEEVKAVVVVEPGTTLELEELAGFVGEALAPFKVPTVLEVRTEPLPRNAAGKVVKRLL